MCVCTSFLRMWMHVYIFFLIIWMWMWQATDYVAQLSLSFPVASNFIYCATSGWNLLHSNIKGKEKKLEIKGLSFYKWNPKMSKDKSIGTCFCRLDNSWIRDSKLDSL